MSFLLDVKLFYFHHYTIVTIIHTKFIFRKRIFICMLESVSLWLLRDLCWRVWFHYTPVNCCSLYLCYLIKSLQKPCKIKFLCFHSLEDWHFERLNTQDGVETPAYLKSIFSPIYYTAFYTKVNWVFFWFSFIQKQANLKMWLLIALSKIWDYK